MAWVIPKKKIAVFDRPDSHDEITRLVHRLLHEADAVDVLPTPMSQLFDVARIKEVGKLPDPESGFIKSLTDHALSAFLSGLQKIRGIADIRDRVVYIPRRDHDPRILFAQGHELGHLCMSWHNVKRRAYQDDDSTLSSSVKMLFEQEANCFGAESIFQGPRFRRRARDYTAEFNSIFHLAAMHGASIQATSWRFIEEQDVAVGALYYYRNKWQVDEYGNSPFTLWKVTASSKFKELCKESLNLPTELQADHPWLAACDSGKTVDGVEAIECGLNGPIKFIWQSWWNTYSLTILLRRKPLFSLV